MSQTYSCPSCPAPLPEVVTIEVWAAPCPECGKAHEARPGRVGAGIAHTCCEIETPYSLVHRLCLVHRGCIVEAV